MSTLSPARLVATVFGAGLLRPAPGTWGSLAALPLAWLVHSLGGPILLTLCTIGAFGLGTWATARVVAATGDEDPSEVVIDELVGQWIALWPVSIGAAAAGADVLALWPGIVAAFLFFRLFDIWKPGPVGWADRRGDPLGVMLDDVFAGIFAALVVMLLAGLAHGVLL